MTLVWWLAWAVVALLLLSAALGSRQVGGVRRRGHLLPWVAGVAAAATLGVVTYDHVTVSGAELDDAVTAVAVRLDGAEYVLPPLEIRRQVGEQLGHPVDLSTAPAGEPATGDRQVYRYDITERADGDAPVMCLTVEVRRGDDGVRSTAASAATDPCA